MAYPAGERKYLLDFHLISELIHLFHLYMLFLFCFVLFCISVFKRRGGFHLFLNKALWSAFFRSGLIIIYCNNIWPEYLLGSPQGIYAELSWDLVYITLYLKQKLLTVTLALLINKGAVCGHLYHGCGPNTL